MYCGYIAWSYKACPSLELFDIQDRYQFRLNVLELSSGRILKTDWRDSGLTRSEIERMCEPAMNSAALHEWF